jgi:D-alanyl-lipoteichoic acid acyltransferase DltB (MBOAT superfamily)
MLFNSLQFLVFFGVVLALYRRLSHRWQNGMLLVASYIFYGAWDWRFLILFFTTTFTDYCCALQVANSTSPARRKGFVALSIAVNMGILGFFKYANFFSDSLAELFAALGLQFHPLTMAIILPVGISFYTFQSMSYTLDVYRGELAPCRNLFDYALYVSFFPQLVAGPVERATHLLPQVLQPRQVTVEYVSEGLYLILWGYFKKVFVADNMALIVQPIFAQQTGFTGSQVCIGALAFAFQIYGDFSGYSDIARGSARLLGFDIMRNFNLPYFARSPQDFWRRWHISLSTWLRDYLYVPLGGNRKGRVRTYVNLMATMVLGGLWHGAAWTFVIWGAYHGLLLSIHRAWTEWRNPAAERGRTDGNPLVHGLQIGAMFILTLYGWLIFRCQSFGQLCEMTAALCRVSLDSSLLHGLAKILFYAAVLICVQLAQYLGRDLDIVRKQPPVLQAAIHLLALYLLLVFGVFQSRSFIYFQF